MRQLRERRFAYTLCLLEDGGYAFGVRANDTSLEDVFFGDTDTDEPFLTESEARAFAATNPLWGPPGEIDVRLYAGRPKTILAVFEYTEE